MEIKRTERGWAGHFCAAHGCGFRRNTLLECRDLKLVISTVGNYQIPSIPGITEIGCGRYYETMVFHALWDDKFLDADVCRGEIPINSKWCISTLNSDIEANDMHEAVVAEMTQRLSEGDKFLTDREENAEILRDAILG